MKSLVNKLRYVVAALAISAAVVVGVTSCTPPNASGSNPNYTSAVFKSSEGDWFKLFYEDGKVTKYFAPSVTYDDSWNATYAVSVEDGKSKSYDELIAVNPIGCYGIFENVEGDYPTPNGGKMLLLKTASHTNYTEGYCYEDASIGTEKHSDCYIPCVYEVSSDGNTVVFLQYYNTGIKNEGKTGTACFKNKTTAIENLPYAKSTWSTTTYTKQ
ncbi:MAG: hypothetical protein MJ184_01255 [Treponema sp.]|uniref:hypothetical protein n=1 Tax=Treponema sp. TaxID=166 RepID=UPI00298EB708|nr:hypothetical protein [Treponema sp.]MCQ2599972.1 hypothetical protein [Treponema sp.]